MPYRLALIGAILLAFAVARGVENRIGARPEAEYSPRWQCRRIVSMAPGITAMLDTLGLGDRTIPCEGTVEAIVWQRPDLVIMLNQQAAARPCLDRLKIETLVVSLRSDRDVVESLRTIGRVCGKGAEARTLAHDIEERLDAMRKAPGGRH